MKKLQNWLILFLLLPWIVGFTIFGRELIEMDGDAGTPSAIVLTNGTALPAASVVTDTSGFDNNLNPATATTVQAALDELDELVSAQGTTISQDDSSIVVDDDAVDPGTITITMDGEVVAIFAAAGNSLGPIAISAALSANETYSTSNLLTGLNGGETTLKWTPVVFTAASGEFMAADADAATLAPAWGILVEDTSNGAAAKVLKEGYVRYDTWNWTVGATLYLGDTVDGNGDGVFVEAASKPATTGDIVQPVGIAVTADIVYFDFDPINGFYTVE